MIQAVTEEIDGPDGWLGRALGPQTLEMSGHFGSQRIRLPYVPIIDLVSIITVSEDGDEAPADPATYRLEDGEVVVSPGATWVIEPKHRIRYIAGYNGSDEGKTGAVPERARQAIILSVQDLMRARTVSPILRSETVDGVGSKSFLDGDKLTAIVERTCDRLLSTLRVNVL
ncbi:hypothetical protein C7I85_26320 [Mesorhizobium soli]|uniref:Uncharacterized protein n=2 Tax=Pseudaminobacter soli (ex Li et al. 2025) TaxID=1295366 RepID=A0A2P7S029_9HYPH|nr:hypothetical protein C7I85_26320 [Mesorhizobium soli]